MKLSLSAKTIALWLLGFALAAFFALTLFPINYPGLHYDELFFVNAALGDLNGMFVYAKFGKLPLFLMPYIGALKAWIYWPIFKLFGVSVWSIRLPILLIGAAGLSLFFRVGWILGGPITGALATLLLVANSTFVWGLKAEVGPVAIEFLLQALGAFAFFQGAGPILLSCLFLLGIFNKVSFIWWVTGFVSAGMIVFPERRRALLIASLCTVLYLPLWHLFFHFANPASELGSFSFLDRWNYVRILWTGTLDGSIFYALAFGDYKGMMPYALYWFEAILAAGIFYGFVWKKTELTASIRFLLIQVLITFACIFLTGRATSYWHFFHLLTWFILLSVLIFRQLKLLGLAITAILLIQYSLVTKAYIESIGKRPAYAFWSTANYQLIDWCAQEKRKCVSIDWGTGTLLLAFIRDPARVWEFGHDFILDPSLHYIAYANGEGVTPEAKQKFFALVNASKWEAKLETHFDDQGKSILEVYQLIAKGIPAPDRTKKKPRILPRL
jgi:hypothetical protein